MIFPSAFGEAEGYSVRERNTARGKRKSRPRRAGRGSGPLLATLCAVGGFALFVFASVAETVIRMTTGMVLFDAWIGGGVGFPLRFVALGLPGESAPLSTARLLLDWAFWCAVLCGLLTLARALARR
jgi:hypothetical protein